MNSALAVEKQAVRDRLQFDSLFGPGASDRVLAKELPLRLEEMKQTAPKHNPGLFDQMSARLLREGFNAREVSAILAKAALNAPIHTPPAPSHLPSPARPAEPGPAASAGATAPWTLASLSALVDAVCGAGTAGATTRRPVLVDLKAREKIFAGAGRAQLRDRAVMFAEHQKCVAASLAPEHEREDRDRLRGILLSLGVKVPGLSYAGLRPPSSDELVRNLKMRELAQRNADAFMAVLGGDEVAGASTEAGAIAARRFIQEVKGEFSIGARLDPTIL